MGGVIVVMNRRGCVFALAAVCDVAGFAGERTLASFEGLCPTVMVGDGCHTLWTPDGFAVCAVSRHLHSIGTVRETFFLNQLKTAGHRVVYPPKGDFKVDGRILFEIGGKGKTFKQIADIPDSYVANDDVEIGLGNKIPLWLFGFLY